METEETKTVGLTKDGSYQFGLRKTFRVSPGVAWDYLFTKEGLSIWLGHVGDPEEVKLNETYRTEEGIEGKLTTFKPYSHFRMSWKKPAWRNSTILQVRVLDNKGKATIAIHHENLLDRTQRDEVEVYWNNVMDKLGLKFGD